MNRTPLEESLCVLLEQQTAACVHSAPFQAQAKAKWYRTPIFHKQQAGFQYFPILRFSQETFAPPEEEVLDVSGSFASYILPECRENFLLFINGRFCRKQSKVQGNNHSVQLLELSEAMRSYGQFFHKILKNACAEEENPLALWNLAVYREGAFLYFLPNTQHATPVQVLHVQTQEGVCTAPRVHVLLGKHAQGSLILTEAYGSAVTRGLVSGYFEFSLEEGAFVQVNSVVAPLKGVWHFETMRGSLKAGSRIDTVHATRGSSSVSRDIEMVLLGENSEAHLSGVWLLHGNNQAHTRVRIEHAAEQCRSMQHFKGVVQDGSQSSFEGNIYVRPVAQKTQAYQLNHNLVLGERAFAHSKPQLEIFADDVKASHGATVAQLDPSHLWYLQTRGIGKRQAKQLLVQSFLREITDKISSEPLRQDLNAAIEEYADHGL